MKNTLLNKLLPLGLCAAMFGGGTALTAQHDSSDVRLGARLSFANPIGDLAGSKLAQAGYGISAVLEIPLDSFTDGFSFSAIRIRGDWMAFGDNTETVGVKNSAGVIDVMGDYIYRFQKDHDGGPYAFVGAGVLITEIKQAVEGDLGYSSKQNGGGLAFGLGWNWNRHLGAEVKYTRSLFLKFVEKDFDFSWFEASLTYRF
jgi:hypothetical protein